MKYHIKTQYRQATKKSTVELGAAKTTDTLKKLTYAELDS